METWLVFLSVLLLISIAALPATVWLMGRQQTLAVERVTSAASNAISALATVSSRQAELLDKSVAVIATKDPMAYQAVQAMNGYGSQYHEAYDPSDEAEIERMKQLRNEENDGDDQLDPADEREYLAAIGVPVDNV